MSSQRNSTRQRLIKAALELFASQGVTATTTRQIAELAGVNEVTLFRQFGNKHGLLLAVIEDAAMSDQLSQSMGQEPNQIGNVRQVLKNQARAYLQSLEQMPKFVQSVVGEAGQYPAANRRALGRVLTRANRYVAQDLAVMLQREQLQADLPIEKLASLLNGMLLGYAIIEFTSEFHELWEDRDDFLDSLVQLFLCGAVSQTVESTTAGMELAKTQSLVKEAAIVEDLPANLVHSILRRAKKLDIQDYALAYVLFGAGLTVEEITSLQRSHQVCDSQQHVLHVSLGKGRRVPVNQWIMGKRYGSYHRNPLTQWLKCRKDEESALFLNEAERPMTVVDVRSRWQVWTEGLLSTAGRPLAIEQAQQTWCVEMLMKGMKLSDLNLLTGWGVKKLRPYAHRAREKLALDQAMQLDQKSHSAMVKNGSSTKVTSDP